MQKHQGFDSTPDRDSKTGQNENDNRPACPTDLIELILDPLSAQVDRARLEILARIKEVNDSMDAIAGQIRREMDE